MSTIDGKDVKQHIQELRDMILDSVSEICSERALLITEAYKEHEGASYVIKKAWALKKILSGMTIYLEKAQRIAGNQASKMRAAPVFPEYSVDWIEDELDSFSERTGDVFQISEKVKKDILGIIPYWRGRTHEDQVLRTLPEEVKKAWKIGVISPGGITHTGDGHLILDFYTLLEKGIPGYKKEISQRLDGIDFTDPEQVRRVDFLKATKIALEGLCVYISRYQELITDKAAETADQQRKKELEVLADTCQEILTDPPRSFYGALQLVMFVHIILHIESNGHSFSLGRFDQYMYPYYRRDMETGRITRQEALDLLGCFYVKLNTINKVRPWGHTEFGVGYATYQNMIIGGVDRDGNDATNELSGLCLEADELVRLFQPNLAARIHPDTDKKFAAECSKAIRRGFGKPALFNDSVIITSLMELGIPIADAREYAMVGCVTPIVPGKWNHRCTGMSFINIAKILELGLNGGKDPVSGDTLLESEKSLEDCASIEEVWGLFEKQFAYFTNLAIMADNVCDLSSEKHDADAFCSMFINDCLERGKTAKTGGAVYDFTSGLLTGASTTGDSFSALDHIIFSEKVITGKEMLKALQENWAGESGRNIRKLCKQAPKFGNDDVRADANVARVYRMYMKLIKHYRTLRYGTESIGCRWTPSTATISANTPMGSRIGATPDGREAFKPVNEGASPCHGADIHGPTATMLSVARLPNSEMSGGQLLNMKFDPSALEGDEGIEKFIHLVRTFFNQGGYHVQFNVVSAETLKEAKLHPERHRDLIVRVAAYCALFTSLAPDVQDEIIARTEHKKI